MHRPYWWSPTNDSRPTNRLPPAPDLFSTREPPKRAGSVEHGAEAARRLSGLRPLATLALPGRARARTTVCRVRRGGHALLFLNLIRNHQDVRVLALSQPVSLFAWLISHQPAVLFSQNKPATSNQSAVLFSQNKPAPVISHQPTEQVVYVCRLQTIVGQICCRNLIVGNQFTSRTQFVKNGRRRRNQSEQREDTEGRCLDG
jgi:hypothetical protein